MVEKFDRSTFYHGMVGCCNSKKTWLLENGLTYGGFILLGVGLMIKRCREGWTTGEHFQETIIEAAAKDFGLEEDSEEA